METTSDYFFMKGLNLYKSFINELLKYTQSLTLQQMYNWFYTYSWMIKPYELIRTIFSNFLHVPQKNQLQFFSLQLLSLSQHNLVFVTTKNFSSLNKNNCYIFF